MGTVEVEVIAPLISGVRHCRHCQPFLEDAGISTPVQQEELGSYPEEMWQDYTRLSSLVRNLVTRYGDQLRIVLIDPHTPMGFVKCVRHWVRKYPTFIVNGRTKYTGWDERSVDTLVRAGGALEKAGESAALGR
jgi:hypothetical protein